jgi:hypothetical protein
MRLKFRVDFCFDTIEVGLDLITIKNHFFPANMTR